MATNVLFLSIVCFGFLLSYHNVLTLKVEEYMQFKGKDLCGFEKTPTYQTLCIKIAQFNNITGYVKEKLTLTGCVSRMIPLIDKNGAEQPTKANFLYCGYMKDVGVNPRQPARGYEVREFATKYLGKGIGENDVMEYTPSKPNKAIPGTNRVNLLNQV